MVQINEISVRAYVTLAEGIDRGRLKCFTKTCTSTTDWTGIKPGHPPEDADDQNSATMATSNRSNQDFLWGKITSITKQASWAIFRRVYRI